MERGIGGTPLDRTAHYLMEAACKGDPFAVCVLTYLRGELSAYDYRDMRSEYPLTPQQQARALKLCARMPHEWGDPAELFALADYLAYMSQRGKDARALCNEILQIDARI